MASPDITEIANECIWNALENAIKNGLKSVNGYKIWPTMINTFEVHLMVQFRLHLIIRLQLLMHKSVPKDSIKDKIKEVLYDALEDTSNILF